MASSPRFLLATTFLVVCVLSESFAFVPTAASSATATAPTGIGVSSPKTGYRATTTAGAATAPEMATAPARGTAGATDRWRPSFTSSRVVCSSLHLSNICHGNSCDNRNDHASFSKPRTKTDRATTVSTEHHHLQQQQRRRQQRPQKVSQQGSSIDVPLTRQGVVGVGSAAAKMGFAGLLAGAGLGLFDSTTVSRTAAAAADAGGGLVEEYSSPDGTFALHYPSTFKGFSKPLKTHKFEVNFKSEEVKGYEVGVAVDPVRIESLETFGTPEEDYFVESTRGFKHFVAKVTIKDNLLYSCTAQAKEKDYPEVEDELKRVVDSFRVPA